MEVLLQQVDQCDNQLVSHFDRLPPDLKRELLRCCSLTLRAVVLQRACREWRELLQGDVAAVNRPLPFAPDLPPIELEAKAADHKTGFLVAAYGSLEQLTWMHQHGYLHDKDERLHQALAGMGDPRDEEDDFLSHLFTWVTQTRDVSRAQWLWDHGYRPGWMGGRAFSGRRLVRALGAAGSNAMRDWVWAHGGAAASHNEDVMRPVLASAAVRRDGPVFQWLLDHGFQLRPKLWAWVVAHWWHPQITVFVLDWLHQQGCPSWDSSAAAAAKLRCALDVVAHDAVIQWFTSRGLQL